MWHSDMAKVRLYTKKRRSAILLMRMPDFWNGRGVAHTLKNILFLPAHGVSQGNLLHHERLFLSLFDFFCCQNRLWSFSFQFASLLRCKVNKGVVLTKVHILSKYGKRSSIVQNILRYKHTVKAVHCALVKTVH